jgi:hypothetical protein
MRRRRKLVLFTAAGCALLLLGGAVWLLLRPLPLSARINAEAFERIEPGMTPAEVGAVIGLPPGDYRSDPASVRRRAEFLPQKGARVLEWEGDGFNIQVRVDEGSGRVRSKICGEPLSPPAHPFLERLRALAGW